MHGAGAVVAFILNVAGVHNGACRVVGTHVSSVCVSTVGLSKGLCQLHRMAGLAQQWLSAPSPQWQLGPQLASRKHGVHPPLTWACGCGQCGREPGASALEGTVGADVGQRQHCVERRPGAVALLGRRRHSRATGGTAIRQGCKGCRGSWFGWQPSCRSNRLAIAKPREPAACERRFPAAAAGGRPS